MPNVKPLRVYAIVVTFNGVKWVDNCFGSLIRSNIPIEIVVVDNASTDNTLRLIKSSFPTVKVIETETNQGFGKANNIGIELAKNNNADYIVLLNQDAWIEPNTVEVLVNLALKNKEYGILSGLHLDGDKSGLDLNFSKQLTPEKCPGFLSDIVVKNAKEIYQIDFIPAAFWLITRNCFEKVGLFEPMFKTYGEDCNYIERAYYHGYNIGITPLTSICHDRKGRKGEKSISVDEEYLNFMLNVLNPNTQFQISYLKSVLKILIKSFVYLVKLNFSVSVEFFSVFFKAIFSYNNFTKARKSYL